jgi:hypothetical protein
MIKRKSANGPQPAPWHGRNARRSLGIAPKRAPKTVGPFNANTCVPAFGGGLVHSRAKGLKSAVEAGKHLPVDAYGPGLSIIRVIGNLIDPGHERYQPCEKNTDSAWTCASDRTVVVSSADRDATQTSVPRRTTGCEGCVC